MTAIESPVMPKTKRGYKKVRKEKGGQVALDLFDGDYEDRRKFGIADIFNTLGITVGKVTGNKSKPISLVPSLLPEKSASLAQVKVQIHKCGRGTGNEATSQLCGGLWKMTFVYVCVCILDSPKFCTQ